MTQTRIIVFAILLFMTSVPLSGQSEIRNQVGLPLWPGQPPGALGETDKDIPKITPYLVADPEQATPAMVVFPGGGYGGLASHEGRDYALWFNSHGIQAFVVQYRLGSAGYRHPIMLGDASRAVRWVRAHAKELGVDPKRVGVIGSSAGGHLASTVLTHFDEGQGNHDDPIERESSRPDLGILCYPVITMGQFTHQGSKRNLLGPDPDPALIENLSNEKQVTKDTPPCFLWHTVEDTAVPIENSLFFVAALRQSGVPFSFHAYDKGRHGLGLGAPFSEKENYHLWVANCEFWLSEMGFIVK